MTTSTRQQSVRLLGTIVVLMLIFWGARVTYLEGFALKWPDFNGDFAALMFGQQYWKGHRGIAYGPIFVIESWLVGGWPAVFTPVFFALANIPLTVGAFVLCVRACRASATVVFISVAAWLCYWRLFYGFTVSANPEFLELFFLSVAWFAAKRRSEMGEGLGVAAAALTKLVPWVFTLLLILRRSVRALAVAALAAIAVLLVVGTGQRMSPSELVLQAIMPLAGAPAPPLIPSSHSTEWVGVLEALARVLYKTGPHPLRGAPLHVVQALFVLIIVVCLCGTVWATLRLNRRRSQIGDETSLALTYAMYFTLVPILTVAAHHHTFLFLLPVWIVWLDQLWKDDGPVVRRAVFTALVAFCYAQTGVPAVFALLDKVVRPWFWLRNSWVVAEPMVGTVLLMPVLWAYIALRTRTAVSAESPAARAGEPALPPLSTPVAHHV